MGSGLLETLQFSVRITIRVHLACGIVKGQRALVSLQD
jgi:hypothetical protein